MAKPIAIVYINPNQLGSQEHDFWRIYRDLVEIYEGKMPDYYWFVLPDDNLNRIELEVRYEKDFTEIQYAELKKIIEDSLPKNKNNNG